MTSEQSSRPMVLLVDDNATIRDLAARILALEGYQVLTAENGEEALALASTLDGQLGLVVTDIRMPVMDGLELATHLARLKPTLPVVFISGFANSLAVPGPVLAKPFGADTLLAAVAQFLPVITDGQLDEPDVALAPGGQRRPLEG